jgi:hypothetical protein
VLFVGGSDGYKGKHAKDREEALIVTDPMCPVGEERASFFKK